MGLVTAYKPKPVKAKHVEVVTTLGTAMVEHFDAINAKSYFPKPAIEEILLRDMQHEIHMMKNRFTTPEGLVKFTPSGASKCRRELFYKTLKARQDDIQQAPFNNRWTRNSSAIHKSVQHNLLYANTLLPKPYFSVLMVEKEGFGLLPAWEKNIEKYEVIEHNGVKFVVSGMMDGLLKVNSTGQTVGFEYKTKSNDSYQIEKMTKPSPQHILQCVSYSLIFKDENGEPVNDYILTYEAVAKDRWDKGEYALQDVKAFHITITERQKKSMLKKFSEVADMIYNGELPKQETSKCMFCGYKGICLGGN